MWKFSSLFHNIHVDQQSKTKDYKQANIHMKFPQRLIFVAVFAF